MWCCLPVMVMMMESVHVRVCEHVCMDYDVLYRDYENYLCGAQLM